MDFQSCIEAHQKKLLPDSSYSPRKIPRIDETQLHYMYNYIHGNIIDKQSASLDTSS